MIQAHTLIKTLYENIVEPDPEDDWEKICADKITRAQKFLVRNGEMLWGDELQSYAFLLCKSGLLRLPFPECYFEIQNIASYPQVICIGALAFEMEDRVCVRGFIRFKNTEHTWELNTSFGGWRYGVNSTKEESNFLNVINLNYAWDDTPEEEKERRAILATLLCACAVAFMDLKEVDRKDCVVSGSVNASRARRERPPFHSHTLLTIKPTAKAALAAQHGSLIERRAHWRRGHLRHLPTKIVPVAPALIRGKGFVSKDYRI